ncbi:MAG: hypothetical protein FJ123_20910, partial [Deltaproteobacteria bacterium]|nr:hypothetical protein [Deltaproteobacteria bacterium]
MLLAINLDKMGLCAMISLILIVHYEEQSSSGDERMTTESIQPIRMMKYARPQQEWKVIIAIYLYLAGMGAGSFIIGILIHWTGVTFDPLSIPFVDFLGVRFDLAKFLLLWGPIMVSIGAPFLILDLGIKWRF